jgi:hypothetical protein
LPLGQLAVAGEGDARNFAYNDLAEPCWGWCSVSQIGGWARHDMVV